MEYDLAQLVEAGLDTVTGIDYTGSEEKYISAVQRFYKNHEKNSTKVLQYFDTRDYENYGIAVHALKSNAKMIGAGKLSLLFEELETLAKAGDTKTIEDKTRAALTDYANLVSKLEPVVGQSDIKARDEISAEEAKKIADELLSTLDDFDDEASKELIARLGGYPFRVTQRDKLAEAAGYLEDFRYEDAYAIIKEIYMHIE